MALPETVSPGQLITADLINDMLAALRDYQSIDARLSALAQAVAGIARRVQSIEDLIDNFNRNNNDLRGRVDRLFIDRDDILVKLDDLRGHVLPDIRDHFNQIEANIANRFDPIERRVSDVELRIVRNTDPIERLPGMTAEQINLLRSRGIENVADLKAHRAEIADIFSNDLDALRIGNMIERIG